MKIELSDEFKQSVAKAASALNNKEEKIYLESPYRGFYVIENEVSKVFRRYPKRDLGINEDGYVNVVCEDMFGRGEG